MARRTAAAQAAHDAYKELESYEEYQLEDDNFVENLRSTYARVRSSAHGGYDPREDSSCGGFDALRLDFND